MKLTYFWKFLLPMVLCLGPVQAKKFSANIYISKRFSHKHQKLLSADLQLLDNFTFSQGSHSVNNNILGIESFDNATLTSWLEERAKFLFPKDFLFEQKIKELGKKDFDYPDLIPNDLKKNSPYRDLVGLEYWKRSTELMSNYGTSLYWEAKNLRREYRLTVRENIFKTFKFKINSPRVGIISVDDEFFSKNFAVEKNKKKSVANGIARLATLFHEARHSDGHALSMGFFHTKCPLGHDYANLNACDNSSNGPYSVGAALLKEFIRNCDSCSVGEKESLRLRMIDSQNRVNTRKENFFHLEEDTEEIYDLVEAGLVLDKEFERLQDSTLTQFARAHKGKKNAFQIIMERHAIKKAIKSKRSEEEIIDYSRFLDARPEGNIE